MTARLFVLDRCACGNAVVHHEPFALTCGCGREWLPARRAANADWATQLVVKRLLRLRQGATTSASGKWCGLDAAGMAFCDRVMTASCSDRWVKTVWYALAVDLVNATHNADRAQATKSSVACTRYRQRMVYCLDHFQAKLHAAELARS
jgi:hypothetical protein